MRKATKSNSARDLDKEITALIRMKDEDIDFSDIPEITDWSKAKRNPYARRLKGQSGSRKAGAKLPRKAPPSTR